MKISASLAALALFLSASASADEACKNGFSLGSGGCAIEKNDSEYQRADKKLNATYKEVLESLKDSQDARERRKALLAVQRQWVQLRDAWCAEVRANFNGGDQWGIAKEEECQTLMTKHRTEELEQLFNG